MNRPTTLSTSGRRGLTAAMVAGLVLVYLPLAVVLVNSFNKSRTFGWPPTGFTASCRDHGELPG